MSASSTTLHLSIAILSLALSSGVSAQDAVFRTTLPSPILFSAEHEAPGGGDTIPSISLMGQDLPKAIVGRVWSYDFTSLAEIEGMTLADLVWSTDVTTEDFHALPGTVAMDGNTGVLEGVPSSIGDYAFDVVASFDEVEGRRRYVIEVGADVFHALGVTSNHSQTCAIALDRTVWCWGRNDDLNLGNASIPDRSNRPVMVQGLSDVVEVGSGWRFTCARRSDASVWCWGDNAYRQLGRSGADSADPVRITGVEASRLIVSDQTACAITTGGDLWCWGDNSRGLFGQGHTDALVGAVEVMEDVAEFAKIETAACAVKTNGQAYCWGASATTLSDVASWTYVPTRSLMYDGYRQLRSGNLHLCGIHPSGDVRCKGNNQYGQLTGTNTTVQPRSVSIPGVVSNLFVGGHSNCARTSIGDVYCWGGNQYGMLGMGNTTQRNTPVRNAIMEDVSTISLGYHASCIIDDDELRCAGHNGQGTLGTGDFISRNVFTPVVAP